MSDTPWASRFIPFTAEQCFKAGAVQADAKAIAPNAKTPSEVLREGVKRLSPTQLNTRSAPEADTIQMILDKLAESTHKSYSVGWRWWSLFCRARGVEPLRFVNEQSRKSEEELFLDFAVHISVHCGKSEGP